MVVYDRKKGESMILKNDIVFIISVLIGVLTLIGALAFNQYAELKSMERNIESAIVKGIDPVAVRCAYKADSTMCAIYATKAK
jgi:uncharacterized membrane protein